MNRLIRLLNVTTNCVDEPDSKYAVVLVYRAMPFTSF